MAARVRAMARQLSERGWNVNRSRKKRRGRIVTTERRISGTGLVAVLVSVVPTGCGENHERAACREVGGEWLTAHGSSGLSTDDITGCFEPPTPIRVNHIRAVSDPATAPPRPASVTQSDQTPEPTEAR